MTGSPHGDADASLAAERPTLLLVSLGGTIAMAPEEGGRLGDRRGGVAPRLDGDRLVAGVPDIEDVAVLRSVGFRLLPGAHLSLGDVAELAELLDRELARGDVAGAVVTQGTDTIEETAFALDVLVRSDAPIAVTGAMRNPTLPSPDGAANLLAAVRVAADPAARGLGTLVVMNDEIHAASWVQKAHTANVAAFASPLGPLGWVVEGRPLIGLRPATRPTLELTPQEREADVALVTAAFADSGATLDGLERRVDAVVVEALGGGHLPATMLPGLDRLLEHVPVVLTSRTGRGGVLRETYDFPGSELDLLERGVVHGGRLDGPKARVLALLTLGRGDGRAELSAAFRQFGGGEEGV